MSQREQQKTNSRQAIVASAAGLIRQRGIGGTSVQAAMAGAGLTVGAFYAHFEDKAALLNEAFTVAMGDALGLVSDASEGLTGADAMRAVLARYLSEEHRDTPAGGCPLPAALGEGAVLDPQTSAEVVTAGLEEMRALVMRISGRSETEALALVALMVGGQILARALRGLPVSSEVLAACRDAGERLLDGSAAGRAATR
jgi:TetR/AcrR family transcriptional repressor of nem operon